MSDLVISYLRGVVPAAWSVLVTALLGWAATHVPWVLDVLELLNVDLQSTATVAFVTGLVFAAWLAIWRRIEPHVPDWLSRIAMGSALTPAYRLGTVYPVATYNTDDKVMLTDGNVVTIGSIIMNPHVDEASYEAHYPGGDGPRLVRESAIARLVSHAE